MSKKKHIIIENEAKDDEIDQITSTVLDFIQPSNRDVQKVKSIEKEIKDEIKNYKIPQIVDVKTGGSFAKDTNLKKDMDVDIFILIDKNVNEQDVERNLLDGSLKAANNHDRTNRSSEHPCVY